LPKPKAITLNVYNSTNRNGLARKTANQLASRGFTIGSVKNDPTTRAVKIPAEVRYGPKGALAARVVVAEVIGARLVKDKRTSTDVDIALGAAFQHLASAAQVKAALSPKPSPSSSC
jgi:LytR cell envelope-related transcriptional attenuator